MARFQVVGPGGDPGESGIYDRQTGRQVVGSYELAKRGYDIHNVVTWSDEAIRKLAERIQREERLAGGCVKFDVYDL